MNRLKILLLVALAVLFVFLLISPSPDQNPPTSQENQGGEQTEEMRTNSGCIQISVNTPGPANAVLYSSPAIRAGHVYENCCYEGEGGLYTIGQSANVAGRIMTCTAPPEQGGYAAWVPVQ